MEQLSLQLIRCDGGTQSRLFNDESVVAEYKEAMIRGEQFAPVVVFFDGTNYWLADGFHRVRAAKDGNLEEIGADVRQGTQRDAILYSVGANSQHGLKRTNADKRRAVKMLLDDAEWGKWTPAVIAEKCGVSEHLVRGISDEFHLNGTRTGKDGKSYPSKKASRTKKAPKSSESQNGAGSSSPQNKSNDESKTPDSPAQPEKENQTPSETGKQSENSPSNTNSDLEKPSLTETSASDGSNSTALPESFKAARELCLFLARNGGEIRANDELFHWLINEAKRLSGVEQ